MNFSPPAYLLYGPGRFPLFFIGFEGKPHDKVDDRSNPVLMAAINGGHGVMRAMAAMKLPEDPVTSRLPAEMQPGVRAVGGDQFQGIICYEFRTDFAGKGAKIYVILQSFQERLHFFQAWSHSVGTVGQGIRRHEPCIAVLGSIDRDGVQ